MILQVITILIEHVALIFSHVSRSPCSATDNLAEQYVYLGAANVWTPLFQPRFRAQCMQCINLIARAVILRCLAILQDAMDITRSLATALADIAVIVCVMFV